MIESLDWIIFRLSCIYSYGKTKEKSSEPESKKTLVGMQEEAVDDIKADLAERLEVDEEIWDDVEPPYER